VRPLRRLCMAGKVRALMSLRPTVHYLHRRLPKIL
jgi:hypothetical protein